MCCLVIMLYNSSAFAFMTGMIKKVFETELGIVSQCCAPKHVSRCNPQYLENISLKINVKVCHIYMIPFVLCFDLNFNRTKLLLVEQHPQTSLEPCSNILSLGFDFFISSYGSLFNQSCYNVPLLGWRPQYRLRRCTE